MTKFLKNKALIYSLCGIIFLVSMLSVFAVFSIADSNTEGTAYYFDSTASDGGTGTEDSPYNSLDYIDDLDLNPGDVIYIKRGSIFAGQLRLSGVQGTEVLPITVTCYGDSPNLPRVDGHNTVGEGVVYLEDCSFISISSLEICDTATYNAERRGVYIYAKSSDCCGISLSELYVHHIRGVAGIEAYANDGISLEGMSVSDCYVKDVDGDGIAVNSASSLSPYDSGFTAAAILDLKLADNTVSYVGGSAVSVSGTYEGSIVGNKAFECSQNGVNIERSYGSLIEKNEVYSASESAFYAGENCSLTVYQYNYSHDNEGGFFSAYENSQANTELRYNLSLYDGGEVIFCGTGVSVYNNTVICSGSAVILTLNGGDCLNNLIYSESSSASIQINASNAEIKSNLVYGSVIDIDAFKSLNKNGIYTDPMLSGEIGESLASRVGIENTVFAQVEPESPAIGAGVAVDGVSTDAFGNAYTQSIGFYCGSGCENPAVDYELSADDLTEYAYSDIEILRDVVYGTATTYKGGTKTLTLDIYSALDCENRNRPLLLMIHGGGLRSGSTKEQSYAVKISKLMARKGYVVASINYRTRDGADMPTKASSAPALLDAAEDANTALEWLRGQSGVYGFNPDYIFVAGGSAGGATSMCYAFAEDSRGFNKSGVVAVANLWGGPRDVFAECYDSDFSQDDRFPTIFIHGTGDTTMDYNHSLNAYNAMTVAGITTSWNPIAGAEHSLIGYDDTYEMTVELISSFFADALEDKLSSDGYTQPPTLVDRHDDNELARSTPEIIYPNADLYVTSNSYGKNASFEQSKSLYVYDSNNTSYIRKSYMRFDTVMPSEGAYPYNTILNFTVTNVTGVSKSTPLAIAIYGIADNYWFANEITWKNTPNLTEKNYLGTVYVTGVGNYSLDISNYVYAMQQNGNPTVTLYLESTERPESALRATIASYESGNNSPYLACSYSNDAAVEHTLTVKTVGEGSANVTDIKTLHGSTVTVAVSPYPGYVVADAVVNTENLGVGVKLDGNEIQISNIQADTVLTVYFEPDPTLLLAEDSGTVRYSLSSDVITNTTDTSIDGNINPLFLCTKRQSNGINNGADRIIWIKFDIEDYMPDGDVLFEIYCYRTVDFSGSTMPVDVYVTTDVDWSSESLTWNSQPAVDGLGFSNDTLNFSSGAQKIGSFTVSKASTWYSVDITEYVRALKISGFSSFSIALVDSDYTTTSPMARFVSTHGTANLNGEPLCPRLRTEKEDGTAAGLIDLNVSVEGEDNGSVSGYTDVEKDSSSILTVTPNDGYFAIVTVNGDERPLYDGKLCLFGADSDTEIIVKYVEICKINLYCGEGIECYVDSREVHPGTEITIYLSVDAGYKPCVKVNGREREISDNKLELIIWYDTEVSITADSILQD